ncbi:MAG TPA: MFS transporter [Nevskiaceae bacterium]|nr:MFS transporter [Nevskiaceae bacterium]
MSDLAEVRRHWRALLAAALGMGAGLSVNIYITGIFSPHLVAEFGWTKSQFAMVGTLSMLVLISVPIFGRLTDRFGVRRVAAVGAVSMPLSFVGLSLFDGSFGEYCALIAVQTLLGTATTATVYSRLVAERFTGARGLALAIVTCGPAAVGAVGGPLLNGFVDQHGWRAGYQVLAAFSAVASALALALIPSRAGDRAGAVSTRRPAVQDYGAILRSPAFWILVGGMFLCNLPQSLQGLQLKMMLSENGIDSAGAAMMMSAYATGVIVGRFLCGLCLDRYPAEIVAALTMGLPGLGLFVIASTWDAPLAIGAAVLLVGLSQGGESDVVGYLVVRHFPVQIYSSVFGLVAALIGVSSGVGAGLLSASFRFSDRYAPYVFLTGIAVIAGGAMLLLLGRLRSERASVAEGVSTAPG